MKVYVDELPKNCVNCDFGYANNFCELDYEIDLRKFDINKKHTNCPLKSLADHDKQVRKEVCDEIKELVEQKKGTLHNKWVIDYYTMVNILYQIQGE